MAPLTMWPFQRISDAWELRHLRRRLPYVYRRLIFTPKGIRTETDGEYLDRLRVVHMERCGADRPATGP